MKKILALISAVILCVALVACGDNGGGSGTPTEAPTKSGSLEEFLNTTDGYTMTQNFKHDAESGGNCEAECYADGDTLVFEARFVKEIPEDKFDYFMEYLNSFLDDPYMAESFEESRQTLDKYMDSSKISFRIVYRDINGNILAEKYY